MMQVHDELVVDFPVAIESWFPQRIGDCMVRTANKYLDGFITMNADSQVMDHWTK